jgi:apolipoprotein N-acyltransferase
LEWLAGQVGPIAFPWHQLALTLTSVPVLIQVADIAGAEGLGFLLATVNALLALAWWERTDRRTSLRRVEAAATVLFLMALYGMHRVHTLPLQVAGSAGVVQPNVSVEEKWVPGRKDAVVERTAVLAERAIAEGGVDLLVWPETALPDRLERHPSWRARLMQLTKRSGAAIVSGGVATAVGGSSTSRANAALSFDPGSDFHDPAGVIHRKQKLVPFVERVRPGGPDLSRDRAGGFAPGRELALADGPLGRFGAVICYELTFAEAARSLRRSGAGLLVVLSNDAWLGRSTASSQHFAHAVLRAVENRMAVVRSANTGVSGIVDPLGRVVTRTETFEPAYAVGPVERAGVVPPAVWLGGFVGPAALALLLLLTVTCGHRRSSRDPRDRTPVPRPASDHSLLEQR